MRSFCRLVSSVVTTLLIALPLRVEAQIAAAGMPHDSVKVALIRQLLDETHAIDLAVTAMETSLPVQRAANPRIPAVFWDRFVALVHTRRDSLASTFIDVYSRHFSTEDVRQLLAFYRTPVGQKLLAETPAITRESIMAGQAWGAQLGMEVARQLSAEGVKMPGSGTH